MFLGPIGIAGVLWDYRCGLRKLGVDAQLILWYQHEFKYGYDELCDTSGLIPRRAFYYVTNMIEKKIYGSDWVTKTMLELRNRDKIEDFIQRFDVFHFRSGHSLVPHNADVRSLKKAGKKIVMTYWGCDSRCASAALSSNYPEKACLCKLSGRCRRPCRYTKKVNMIKYWSKNADMIFSGLTNSSLLDFLGVPYELAIIPIDTEHWKRFESEIKKDKLLIVHAPSSVYKGTTKITDSVHQLQKKYDFDFKVIQGVPNETVREWLNVADIVVDQFGMGGWYGRLSVESMSMGNPTLSHIKDEHKETHKQFSDLPIINITPDTLYDRLEELIIDPGLRKKIGKESRKYVENIHSSDVVCKRLLDTYRRL